MASDFHEERPGMYYTKVWLPCREEAEEACGHRITDAQFEDFLYACIKGMEGQLDWGIIRSCAADQIPEPDPCDGCQAEADDVCDKCEGGSLSTVL